MQANDIPTPQKGKKRPAAAKDGATANSAPIDEVIAEPGAGVALTSKHESAVAALLSERTIEAAAHRVGISESTLIRWLKTESFSEAYRAARREVVTQAIAQIQRATGQAVETLLEVAGDTTAPASSRVSAARAILDTSLRAVEIEDLGARVEALEAALKDVAK